MAWTKRIKLLPTSGIMASSLAQRSQELPLEADHSIPSPRSGRQTKVFYTSTQYTLYSLFLRESLMFMLWNLTMKWEISLPLNLKQCRWGFSLSGPRHCKPVSCFPPESCAFWCLSGQHLSLKIHCRSKKVIKLQRETSFSSKRFCSLSHSLQMSLYLLFAEQEMHY